ncbi:S-layer homology domain-containing protein [Phosphitispora fastidiosa]|uniref:S-layer homology domain-containing protein n=1 Tax=Phosphitispora fastidiosa TaxID=2837202 RepID=UPI001E2B8DEA|nr:S-layer homology domain-containing protein [Phosphitispora fastidiosa]MBU7005852.1 hypothetical protein [Phosphitispora fastidiosa]
MKKYTRYSKKLVGTVLILVLVCTAIYAGPASTGGSIYAAGTMGLDFAFAGTRVSPEEVRKALDSGVKYLHEYYEAKEFRGLLEDWAPIGLSAAGEDLAGPEWSVGDRSAQDAMLADLSTGTLLKYGRNTDYQRVILNLAALGIDPSNTEGVNYANVLAKSQLVSGKFADAVGEQVIGEQLVNAQVWGIIAMKAAKIEGMNEEKASSWLAAHINPDNGYSIDTTVEQSDIDMSGMALIAFAVLGESDSSEPVVKVLEYLKNNQQPSGGFAAWSMETSESPAAVIQGLTALGLDPQAERWTTQNGSPLRALLDYQQPDGGFAHYEGGGSNLKATAQAVMALADYINGTSAFQRMAQGQLQQSGIFSDMQESHWAYPVVKDLVESSVVNGYPDNTFRPDNPVTRAEFATILVKGLNLQGQMTTTTARFRDLPLGHWANQAVAASVERGYIKGMSETTFAPTANITGAQVAAMLVRAGGHEEEAQAVTGDTWYAGYIRAAETLGLLYPGFDADQQATRAQCAYSVNVLRETTVFLN